MNTHYALLPGSRDPERLLRETVDDWDGGDAWIFGYASLIWRPEFDSVEDRPATVYGARSGGERRRGPAAVE